MLFVNLLTTNLTLSCISLSWNSFRKEIIIVCMIHVKNYRELILSHCIISLSALTQYWLVLVIFFWIILVSAFCELCEFTYKSIKLLKRIKLFLLLLTIWINLQKVQKLWTKYIYYIASDILLKILRAVPSTSTCYLGPAASLAGGPLGSGPPHFIPGSILRFVQIRELFWTMHTI